MMIVSHEAINNQIAHLKLWREDLASKMEACKNDAKAYQEWLHQYLRVNVLIKDTKKELCNASR